MTYLRDRLLLARELLNSTGSIFVQINTENVHHVREVLDEIFGAENFQGHIVFVKTTGKASGGLDTIYDVILWYAKDHERVKFNKLFVERKASTIEETYNLLETGNGEIIRLSKNQLRGEEPIPSGRRLQAGSLYSDSGGENSRFEFEFEGKTYRPLPGYYWRTNPEGMRYLAQTGRLMIVGNWLRYKQYMDDFPLTPISTLWEDTRTGGFASDALYVVQTATKVVARCILMTTVPGDLVLDPTCGSGTTAYVAEQWGRRWITIDTSRVPLALARQRLLTATFPWYELKDEARGPAGGFIYKRKQNKKGEEVGGIVPHITLKSIANNEPPAEEVLVDRPEVVSGVTRVTGAFCVEATIPTPVDWEGVDGSDLDVGAQHVVPLQGKNDQPHVDRMLEVLRKSPVLRLEGNKTVTFKNVRPPAKTLSLSAEALVVNGGEKPVALLFGPENGAVSERLIYEAAREAHAKNYTHLYVIGFAIQPNARMLVDQSADVVGVAATYVQATPDLLMGDLLKNMRSSQIFSVCGLPEIQVHRVKDNGVPSPRPSPTRGEGDRFQVELLGYDVFDPVSMEVDHRPGGDVPAWFLDTDYNDLCFHVTQAFFPRTGAWDNLKKALKGEYEESVWEHLSGTVSAPFEAGEHRQVAVKVVDDRGNELLVVKKLNEDED